jgi:GNAT acetyltransferase-like protein
VSTTIEPVSQARWRELAPSFRDYSYRQLWAFGVECAARFGATSEHVAITDGGRLLGLADIRIKRLPLVGGGIAYMTGAPMVREGAGDPERLRSCLAALVEEYADRRGLVLRVLPPLGSSAWNSEQARVFEQCGFVLTRRAEAYRTMVVDLERPLDDVRKSFAQKWRNGLNRAEKNALAIRAGLSSELFAEFCGLFTETVERKQFRVTLDAGFYARVQTELSKSERFLISVADHEGRAVAGHVASLVGDTCVYLLGASSEAAMQLKASYLLQWHVIRSAHERHMRCYDLGGIDPEGNPGVYHFKEGMGGADLSTPGPYELWRRRLPPLVALAGESTYRLMRGRG